MSSGPWRMHEQMANHRPGEWIRQALCAQVGPVEFFPNAGQSATAAKSVCRKCPVQLECLNYAITSPTALHGIWGGTSAVERRDLRQRRNIRDEIEEDWHGTEAGAKRHARRGEPACRDCMRGQSFAQRERRDRGIRGMQ